MASLLGGRAEDAEVDDAAVITPERLRVLTIMDAVTGRSLYEHHWRWSFARGPHTEGVDNLVKTLLKFAQEIDTGTISCVNFAVPGALDERPTLQMLCERDEHIVVALFHGLPGDDSSGSDADHLRGPPPPSVEAVSDRMRALVGQVRAEFSQQYGAQLEEQRVRPSSVDHWGTRDGDGDESEYDETVSNASLSTGRLSNPAHDDDEAGSGGGESGGTGTAGGEGYNKPPGGSNNGSGGVDDASLNFGVFSVVLTRLCDVVLNPNANANANNANANDEEGGGNSPQLEPVTAPANAPTRI